MVKAVEGGKFFFQLLELGYEKFPHNTTVCQECFSKFIQSEGRNKAAKYWPQGRCGKKAALCPCLTGLGHDNNELRVLYAHVLISETLHYNR